MFIRAMRVSGLLLWLVLIVSCGADSVSSGKDSEASCDLLAEVRTQCPALDDEESVARPECIVDLRHFCGDDWDSVHEIWGPNDAGTVGRELNIEYSYFVPEGVQHYLFTEGSEIRHSVDYPVDNDGYTAMRPAVEVTGRFATISREAAYFRVECITDGDSCETCCPYKMIPIPPPRRK